MNRRKFLSLILWLVPVYFLMKYLSPTKKDQNYISISLSLIPTNGAYLIRDRQIGVIRKDGKIKAISIACTHLGCTLNVEGDKLVCPCHGSVFSLEGAVEKGPAVKDLKILESKQEKDKLIIYV